MTQPTRYQVVQACHACALQWDAFKRAHGQPPHPKYGPPRIPQSAIDRLIEDTGCEVLEAVMAIRECQDERLILVDHVQPWVSDKGRALLMEHLAGSEATA